MKTFTSHPARGRGFSLIELLVSMAIGLVVTLAITSVLIRSESDKRTNSSVNDLDQTGTYITYRLDRMIRSAGSGFAQSRSTAFGCQLDVKKSDNTRILPLQSAITGVGADTAFAQVYANLPIRLAPVIIAKNLADSGTSVRGDVLMVMSGTSGFAESARNLATSVPVSSSSLGISNNLGYSTDDVFLLADSSLPSNPCMLQQVGTLPPAPPATRTDFQTVPLGGTYHAVSGTLVNLGSYGGNSIALQLGNAGTGTTNLPQFLLLGVGGNSTLSAYDLLQFTTTPETPIADSVVEMHALYGVDTTATPDGIIDQWVDPGATGWDPTTLFNSSDTLRRVIAIRVGVILRSPLAERDLVQGAPDVSLFANLTPANAALKYTMAAASVDAHSRYRTFEVTIPLRNVMLAP